MGDVLIAARPSVLSDASPEIAEAWSRSDLAPHFDAVLSSCRAGVVQPARQLFKTVLREVGFTPWHTRCCGGDELAAAERAGRPL
ncbi:hypothetical protein RKE30_01775 [Streptomyces sp. Li-HN-5-11]|uniref:hypothetical protein n=1 Tax=Streptomyces sp. Li-HN-5-11 TaxID=3075432 RepID=UPI0028A5B35B|nr:hypothetical protein [Streptomyces sp. Li-HN-5-11]WNM29223.1 hypothetical protein RKE30_01775 [Streptomyces sp. Li-HN-5-11]